MVVAIVVGAALVGLAAALVYLRARFIAVQVVGDSMAPTLPPGARVLVRRVGLNRVRVGQIVVFAPPRRPLPDDPPWLVKRLVAGPGDPLPSDVPGPSDRLVPTAQFVVLGDNPDRSYDSRSAGPIPAAALLGVVIRVLRHQGSTAARDERGADRVEPH